MPPLMDEDEQHVSLQLMAPKSGPSAPRFESRCQGSFRSQVESKLPPEHRNNLFSPMEKRELNRQVEAGWPVGGSIYPTSSSVDSKKATMHDMSHVSIDIFPTYDAFSRTSYEQGHRMRLRKQVRARRRSMSKEDKGCSPSAADIQHSSGLRCSNLALSNGRSRSISSGDDTDWEEENKTYDDDNFELMFPGAEARGMMQHWLTSAKRQIIERLMDEFWIIFDQKWPVASRQRGVGESCSPGDGQCTKNSVRLPETGKRSRNANDDDDPEKNEGRKPKRSQSNTLSSESIEELPRFACPFRKNNPRKYCVQHWKSCALTPHETVGRVKAHLYRYHLVHQCQRCKEFFDTDALLDSHIEAREACPMQYEVPVHGITRKMKEKIQCRKKAFPKQTEVQRWQQSYETLFPCAQGPIPNPFFEAVCDQDQDSSRPPGSSDLTNFQDYLRREIPRIFRSALEDQVDAELQPVEENLRGQMLHLIEQAQERAFAQYRAICNARPENMSRPPLDGAPSSAPVPKGKGEKVENDNLANFGNSIQNPTSPPIPQISDINSGFSELPFADADGGDESFHFTNLDDYSIDQWLQFDSSFANSEIAGGNALDMNFEEFEWTLAQA